jgi:HTH-type transcriptional regulator / antitoxin HigA
VKRKSRRPAMPNKFKPNWIPHPGVTLRETMIYNGISPAKVAEETNCQLSHVNKVLNGNAKIESHFAAGLERVFPGIPAEFWLDLERGYQEMKEAGE